MTYKVSFKKQAIKDLAKINEPFYPHIKQAIYSLADNPRPNGYKKLKPEMVIALELAITELSTIFLTSN